MITQEQIAGNWNHLKGKIKERWGQISDQELQEVEGRADQLVGLIQQKTGETRHTIEQFLDDVGEKSAGMVGSAGEAARQYMGQAGDAVRGAADQVRERYAGAQELVRRRPAESVAVAFGTGIIAGVIVGLMVRSR